MKCLISFEKEEYDNHIKEIKSKEHTKGFWHVVQMLTDIHNKPNLDIRFGTDVTKEQRQQWNDLVKLLDKSNK